MPSDKSIGAIVAPKPGESSLGITLTIPNLSPVQAVSWLEQAVPQYEQASRKTAMMAVTIGMACMVVRDFGERGSLAALKKLGAFQRSARTLARCIKAAQNFAEASGLLNDKLKLADQSAAADLFQTEFRFGDDQQAREGILAKIAEYVGDSTITDLIEDANLGTEETALPPTGHQDKVKKVKQTPESKARDTFKDALAVLKVSFSNDDWHHLTLGDREKLEDYLTTSARAVREYNKKSRR